ncbi:hypothetical protein BDF21DRAFT_453412 [Thamnidium elegans]|nr:hypothetical protein BDF21DRAFT_453412 [Thamnidium elegans]
MSQQVENNEVLLRSLEPNTSRLPLRKRIAPVLKWQPVETPEEHYKQKTYPPYPSSDDVSDGAGDTTETDEEKLTDKTLKKIYTNQDGKRSSPEDNAQMNRPAKKVKRGRPPLVKHNIMETKPFLTEPPAMPSTPTTTPSTINTSTRPPPDASIDTNVLYCICKRPYDVPRFMIACDKCDQWFHGECIQISEKQGEFIDLYFCENCAKITGKKTSWKPRCANPACQKAARIGTNLGHLSKYCTDTCGMQVARARIELAEMKKRNATNDPTSTYNPLSRGKLSSFADLDDRSRLSRVKDEKLHAKFIISIGEHKSELLSLLIQNEKEEVCGFDSRLSWPESLWEKVHHVEQGEDNNHILLNADGQIVSASKSFTICQQSRKCNKHANWQKLKTSELEQERSEQFVILTMLERERQQIKARMKKRREEVDLVDFLENGTITHLK